MGEGTGMEASSGPSKPDRGSDRPFTNVQCLEASLATGLPLGFAKGDSVFAGGRISSHAFHR